ncbi:MAG: endonuclease/exonuclease/phosphatase family protein [Bacteroidota bacterium]
MKRYFGSNYNFLIVLSGLIILIGKNHFFLGSIYAILLWPLIIASGLKLISVLRSRIAIGSKKTKTWPVLLIGPLLLLSWTYDHLPRLDWSGSAATKKELSILSYNLFFKNNYKQQTVNEIKANLPDVLLVQELSSAWHSKLGASVYKHYQYRKTFVNNRTRGIGIFSRYPIRSHHLIKNRRGLPIFQVCELTVQGEKVVLVNAHMSSPARVVEDPDAPFWPVYQANYALREAEWAELEAYLSEYFPEHPHIVAGDLNTMKMEGLYRQIRHSWTDVFAKQGEGMGLTFPNSAHFPFAIITLDYILGRGVKPLEARVLKKGSSDHFAIWGKVAICE